MRRREPPSSDARPQGFEPHHNWLPRCLEAQGKRAEAVHAYEEGRALHGGNARVAEQLKRIYAAHGWEAYWRERLRLAAGPLPAALAHVRLGNIDEAMAALEGLYDRRLPWITFTNHPEWDPLRSDARFLALRARAGLSDEINPALAAARRAARSTSRR